MKKNKKIKVGIIFGGKSTEHEVSLLSAKNVIAALDREKYEPVLIGIDKEGRWHRSFGANYLLNSENPKLIALNKQSAKEIVMVTGESKELLVLENSEKEPLDVVFPVLHGLLGEDGTVQGLLKLMNIPFVGPSVLGSAIGMDKDVQKRLLRDAGIPVAKAIMVRAEQKKEITFAKAKKSVGLPMFVKPVNAGSSVGVHKVKPPTGVSLSSPMQFEVGGRNPTLKAKTTKNSNSTSQSRLSSAWMKMEKDFNEAVADAFKYDSKILIEEGIDGREIECAVLGNENPVASVPGEVKPNHEFYSYEAKYIDGNGAVCEIPAKLSPQITKKVQEIAVKAFRVLECEGMARVDLFVTKDGRVLVNEINTIPGFTKISMYPKLWEASGIKYSKLINKLIELALARAKREKNLKTRYL